jgi:hypothetical protein
MFLKLSYLHKQKKIFLVLYTRIVACNAPNTQAFSKSIRILDDSEMATLFHLPAPKAWIYLYSASVEIYPVCDICEVERVAKQGTKFVYRDTTYFFSLIFLSSFFPFLFLFLSWIQLHVFMIFVKIMQHLTAQVEWHDNLVNDELKSMYKEVVVA